MHSLPLFLRLAGRPVLLLGTGEAAEAKARLIRRAGGIPVEEDDPRAGEARIAFVALDEEEGEAAAARLKARGLLVNVVDRPDLCDLVTPAIVDRDPLIVAIGTGGASAGLAKAVRQRIERLLPQSLGALAQALHSARGAMRARWPDARARRAALDAALAESGALDPLAEHNAEAVDAWLGKGRAHGEVRPDGRTETIRLSSADPEELTLRAARLLGEADLILHDAAVPPAILARARADAVREALGPNGAPIPPRTGLTLILYITAM